VVLFNNTATTPERMMLVISKQHHAVETTAEMQ